MAPIARVALVVGLAGLGCTRPNPAFQSEAGGPDGSESTSTSTGATPTSEPVTTDMSSETGSTTASSTSTGALSITTGESSTGSTSTASTSSTTSTGDTSTGGPDMPGTCLQALQLGEANSGVHTLTVPGNPGATTEVWCEQELAGGGWLLVGRSAPGAAPAFGWGSAGGDLLDDTQPYSLGLLALKFPASEILLGSYTRGKQLTGRAYRMKSPAGFPAGFDLKAAATSEITTVLGDCTPGGGPAGLRSVGFTTVAGRFRLRDSDVGGFDDVYGLEPGGFVMKESNCSTGGELDNSQGMIFVR